MNKELKKILNSSRVILARKELSLEDLYRMTFSRRESVMAETTQGFRLRKYTYGEVQDRCEAVAKSIYAAIGATHGYVGLEMENSVDWIAAFWGILKSGNKPYLINLRHPQSLSDRILKTLNIQYIIAEKEGELSVKYLCLSALEGGKECPAEFEDEIAIASSGTSLKESICFYNGAAVAALVSNVDGIIRTNKRMIRMHKGTIKNLAFLPFYHIFGLFAVYFWFTCYQQTLVFLQDLGADTILKTCRRHQVTHIFAVPLLWHTIEKQVLKQAEQQGQTEKLRKGLRLCTKLQNLFPFIGADLSQKLMGSVTDRLFGKSVKFCISGGSALRSSALELINGLGYPLHNGYGMSEIGIGSVDLGKRPKDRNKNTIGKPFDSMEYRLNQEGVLEVRGASICTRRLNDGEEYPKADWFVTGDLMEKDLQGNYYIRGRKGDLVIGESGENINPDRLEELFALRGARAFSILGLPSEKGEVLSAVVQVQPYLHQEGIDALWEELRRGNETLPPTQQIRAFYLTTDPIMAQTAIKVSRAYLKRGIADGSIRLQKFSEIKAKKAGEFDLQSPLAQKVLEIIAKVAELDGETIDADAHLLADLGISSLQYFSVLAALAEEFEVSASAGETYCYTLRTICDYIERHL